MPSQRRQRYEAQQLGLPKSRKHHECEGSLYGLGEEVQARFGNSIDIGPISVITLPRLIEMKLSTGRLEDSVDVVKLIKHHQLPMDFADQLAAEVREKGVEICTDEADLH